MTLEEAIKRIRKYQKAIITEPTLIKAIDIVLNEIENK